MPEILAYGYRVDDNEEDEDEGKQAEEIQVTFPPRQARPGKGRQDEREERERDGEVRRIACQRVDGKEQRVGIEQHGRVGLVVRIEKSREERELEQEEGNRKCRKEAN